MKNNSAEFALSLFVIIPLISRFAYGIIMCVFFFFLVCSTVLIKMLLKKCDLKQFASVSLFMCIVVCITLFIQLASLYSGILIFTMRFSLYVAGLSFFVINLLFTSENNNTINESLIMVELANRLKKTGLFVASIFFFTLLRDIIAYGSISFPVPSGIAELRFFDMPNGNTLGFFATISGSYILLGLCVAIFSAIWRNIAIVKRVEQ